MSKGPVLEPEQGAVIETIYVARSIKTTAILEHELDAISGAAAGASTWSAIASAFMSFGAGIVVNAAFQENLNDTAAFFTWRIAPVCFVAAGVCALLAFSAIKRGSKVTKELKKKFQG